MENPIDLLRNGRKEELWQMCCGHIDLSLEQFMAIQNRLMLEQIDLLNNSELGRKIMHGTFPQTVDEFRAQVPLTTYADYCPELPERMEDTLPAKPAMWVRSSGYTQKRGAKWIPLSADFVDESIKVCGGLVILALADHRGDVSQVREHLKALFTMGLAPYATGVIGEFVHRAIGVDFLPADTAEMTFQERVEAGFKEALHDGLDGFGGLASILVAVGEQIRDKSGQVNIVSLLSHPQALWRVTRGIIRSKLAQRPMLPRDIWKVKAILGGGTDNAVFKQKVGELWGRTPLEIYAGTEGGIYASQTWDYEGMTFVPGLNFFEFIPEREGLKWQLDRSYVPKTVLLDEVKPGENYEIIITNLHGGALVRYRMGDVVKITSLRNDRLNIDIPQMVFYSRVSDLIDIAGLGRLTERIIWQAVENAGIDYIDWTARKEIIDDSVVLHVYIEPREGYIASERAMTATVYEQLEKLDDVYHYNMYNEIYGDVENIDRSRMVKVSFLPQGAFSSYISQRQAEGADLGHLKPPHINPSDEVLALLGAVRKVEVEAVVSEEEHIPAR